MQSSEMITLFYYSTIFALAAKLMEHIREEDLGYRWHLSRTSTGTDTEVSEPTVLPKVL